MDKRLAELLRHLNADPSDGYLSAKYYQEVVRAGGAYALELTYLKSGIDLIGCDTINATLLEHHALENMLPSWVFVHGSNTTNLISFIESSAINFLLPVWGVNPYLPPVDHDARVIFLAYQPKEDNLIVLFMTLREEHYEIETPQFWYGIYPYINGILAPQEAFAWNRGNSPQDFPASLDTILQNHPEIIIMYDNLDGARDDADELWDALSAYEADDDEDNDDAVREANREEAESYINAHTQDQLAAMETISSGHFANLKIDTGTVRVWLSRCSLEDGCAFDYPIEIEYWDPLENRWVQYADYPSDPAEQDPSNVIRHDDGA